MLLCLERFFGCLAGLSFLITFETSPVRPDAGGIRSSSEEQGEGGTLGDGDGAADACGDAKEAGDAKETGDDTDAANGADAAADKGADAADGANGVDGGNLRDASDGDGNGNFFFIDEKNEDGPENSST